MFAIDRPYVNLFFHKGCFKELGGFGGVHEHLAENPELVYNYLYKQSNRSKK
jgi:hypothetical protein